MKSKQSERPDSIAPTRGADYAKLMAMALLLAVATAPAAASQVQQRTLAGGQLVLEDVPEIPLEVVHELAPFNDARSTWFVDWTADGRHIYVKTRFDGVHQLHRVDRAAGRRSQLTFTGEPVGEVARQPGGELIAFAMDRGGSGFDQIWLLDPGSGDTRRLTEGRHLNNRMAWSPDGRRLAFRSTRRNGISNDIWIMDIGQPESARSVLEAPDGALWKPVRFSADGKHLLVQHYAGITDSRVYLLDLESGTLALLAGSEDTPTSNIANGFSADGGSVLFLSNERGNSAEIGRVPVAGGEARFVGEGIAWDITEFELSPDGRRGAFVTNEEGISKLYLFDPAQMRWERVQRTPVGVIGNLRFSPDGRRLGMTVNTARTPSDAYVLKLGAKPLSFGRLVRWTRSEAGGFGSNRFVEPRLVHYPAPMITDERLMLIPAFVYIPRGRGPHPVVIYIHGGPEGQFRPSFNPMIQMWVEKLGVAVVAPNVRGSLGYGEVYLEMDDGRLREHAVQDIGALLDWIGEQRELDATRVAVYGASYGGYMSLASAVHFGDRIRAAVNKAGISNFVTYLENTQGYRRDLRRIEYGDERIPEMRDYLEEISPLSNVGKIRIPMLIAQGQNDPVVPVTESQQMVDALRGNGLPVWYLNALNEGHVFEKKENRDIFQQVTYLFLQQYLLGDAGH